MPETVIYLGATLGFMLLVVISVWIFFFMVIDRFQDMLGEKMRFFSKSEGRKPESKPSSPLDNFLKDAGYPPNSYVQYKHTVYEQPKTKSDNLDSEELLNTISFDDWGEENFLYFLQSQLLALLKPDLSDVDLIFNPLKFLGQGGNLDIPTFLIAPEQSVCAVWPKTEIQVTLEIKDDMSIHIYTDKDKFTELKEFVSLFVVGYPNGVLTKYKEFNKVG